MGINSNRLQNSAAYTPLDHTGNSRTQHQPTAQHKRSSSIYDRHSRRGSVREFFLQPGPSETTSRFINNKWLTSVALFVYRRRKIIQIMIVVDIFALFAFHLWFTSAVSYRLDANLTWEQPTEVTTQGLAQRRLQLMDAVDDRLNRDLFAQLEGLNNGYFFDLGSNTVGTTEFPIYNQYQRQPYVANGYIGSRIPNLGQGYAPDLKGKDDNEDNLSNGWPLFNKRYAGSFVAGFYDIQKNTTMTNFPELLKNGYESIIASVPEWTTLTISTAKGGKIHTLDPTDLENLATGIKNYLQTLSFSHGIVTTEFIWLDDIYVRYDLLAHRDEPTLGLVDVQIANLGQNEITVDVKDELDFKTSLRCQLLGVGKDKDGIYIQFQPQLLDQVYATIYTRLKASTNPMKSDHSSSKESVSITQSFKIQGQKNVRVSKFAGVVTSDLDTFHYTSINATFVAAKKSALKFSSGSKAIATHKLAWDKLYGSALAVSVPDDRMITMASRASIYHVAANTRLNAEGVSAALGVGGLSSDSYGGMVFWDTDLWMMNGILPFFPDHARSIVNYRSHTHNQALQNIKDYKPEYKGAAYPWTSGRYGNCTATGPCFDYEYHINMAVARAAWEYYLSGAGDDKFLEETALPLIEDSAQFFSDYVQHNDTLKQYTTSNLTDPDEYANHVDNGAYTNAGISLNMKWAIAAAQHLGKNYLSRFDEIAGNMHLPEADNDQRANLEYTGMNSSAAIKQADVIMLTYPLENEMISDEQAYTNMELYSLKQVSYGPAMTFPIFSIVAADLSESGCASQAYLRKSVQPFIRGPFAQFLEQNNDDFSTNGGTHPAFPFLTAHGGFIQAILHGLMGFRYDYDLKNKQIHRVLRLDPVSLPCLPGGLQISGVKYMGHTLSLSSNQTSFIIKDLMKDSSAPKKINLRIGKRNEKHGKYELEAGKEITVPLFKTSEAASGSISECGSANFYNVTDGAFGDIPSLINDGDNTTHWQLISNHSTAKILVDFKTSRNLTGGYINWGDKPPIECVMSRFNYQAPLNNVSSILGLVDFDSGSEDKYQFARIDKVVKQSDVFEKVFEQTVEISAPFDAEEFLSVEVPERYNLTQITFELAVEAQFLLIEMSGIHDKDAVEGSEGGAKLYEVVFYDK